MTHRERLMKAVKGEWLDRPCAAFWGPHYNLEEANARDLAYATIANQQAYGWDFIKVMESGMYFPEAFGQELPENFTEDMQSWVNVEKFIVNHGKDWLKLKPLEVKGNKIFEKNVEVIKRIADHFQGDVPILPTVFSPVSMAGEMVGGFFDEAKIVSMIEYDTKEVEYGLSVIEETLINLMNAYIDAGADGFFFGFQNGLNAKLGWDAFMEFEHAGSERVINAVKNRTWFNMAHLCNGRFDKEENTKFIEGCLDLPFDAFNYSNTWTDLMPSFADIRKKTDKVLVGGIKHSAMPLGRISWNSPKNNDFSGKDRGEIKERLRARIDTAIEEAGNKLVISGGCGCFEPHRFCIFDEVMEEVAEERAKMHGTDN